MTTSATISSSGRRYDSVAAYRIVGRAHWRAIFDFKADAETADLRAFLDLNGRALTETWLYQHVERPRSG